MSFLLVDRSPARAARGGQRAGELGLGSYRFRFVWINMAAIFRVKEGSLDAG